MPLRTVGEPIPLPLAAVALAAPGAAPLHIPRIEQEQTNWCWAAVAEMILRHYSADLGPAPTQCEMASWRFDAECCSTPWTSFCNSTSWPDTILDNWRVYWEFYASSKSYSKLQHEIGQRRPVIVYYEWTGGSSHVALVIGCDGSDEVLVRDPLDQFGGVGWISYDDLQAAYGYGSWQGTYLNIKPA